MADRGEPAGDRAARRDELQRLVDQADEAALLRAIDGLSATRDWDLLVSLALRCRAAVELGKQLWPVAMHVDYRLALEAPAAYAGPVLSPGAGKFALGPLTEVAAQAHDWASLRPHLGDPISAAAVAAERVLRAEDLAREPALPLGEVPWRLQEWEPAYALPTYRDRSAEFPEPVVATRPMPAQQGLVPAGELLAVDSAVRALRDLVEPWVSQSAGCVRAVCVEGGANAAVATLLATGETARGAALLQVTPDEALALMQWAAASGGAYGYRRGGAAGRFAAWWTAAQLTGVPWDTGPDFADDLGDALAELQWFRWSPPAPEPGWVLRLAVTDPIDRLAWAVEGLDQLEPKA